MAMKESIRKKFNSLIKIVVFQTNVLYSFPFAKKYSWSILSNLAFNGFQPYYMGHIRYIICHEPWSIMVIHVNNVALIEKYYDLD